MSYNKQIRVDDVAEKLLSAIREGTAKPVSDEVWEEIEIAANEPYIKMADRIAPVTGTEQQEG